MATTLSSLSGGLECLRALYRPHLTDEAADLQIAKDTERVECYKSTKPAPQRHKFAQTLISWDAAVLRLQVPKQEPSDLYYYYIYIVLKYTINVYY